MLPFQGQCHSGTEIQKVATTTTTIGQIQNALFTAAAINPIRTRRMIIRIEIFLA